MTSATTDTYLNEDTIAAIASGLGGPIAVVRISGKSTRALLAPLLPEKFSGWDEPRRTQRATLRTRTGKPIDDVVVVYFKGGASYTGEDSVEIYLHGGAWLVSRAMEEIFSAGARRALPGEFSFRAVRNGKLTLAQAEAVHDLIGATNDRATDLALEKVLGGQARWVEDLAEEIRQLVAMGELGIDFADQDVEEVSLPVLQRRALDLRARLEAIHDSYVRGRKIQDGFRSVFLGTPNAGKSSLFNALLGEERSIVAAVPGTTRDVVHEILTLRGTHGAITLRLEDTAGLRNSSDQIEEQGIARSRAAARAADLLIWTISLEEDEKNQEERLLSEWEMLGCPHMRSVGVLTKADLPVAAERRAAWEHKLQALRIPVLGVTSAVTGDGISAFAAAVADRLAETVRRDPGELLLTRLEHQTQVGIAITHLDRALSAELNDLFAADLKQALISLSPLIGITIPDDILGRIFSKFCIGK